MVPFSFLAPVCGFRTPLNKRCGGQGACRRILTEQFCCRHNVFESFQLLAAAKDSSLINRWRHTRIQLLLACGIALTSACWWPSQLPAQKRVSSEKTTLPELGDKPSSVLRVEKLKGTVKKVDLEKRTVTVDKSGEESTFTFPTTPGREKISLSKKVMRALGKKSLRLEDLKPGSQVKVAYYPTLGTIMEITIEELGH